SRRPRRAGPWPSLSRTRRTRRLRSCERGGGAASIAAPPLHETVGSAPASAAGRAAAAARRLVLDERALGGDDVPLAAVEVLPLPVRLARGRVARVGVERPLVVRHAATAGRVLDRADHAGLRRPAHRRL